MPLVAPPHISEIDSRFVGPNNLSVVWSMKAKPVTWGYPK